MMFFDVWCLDREKVYFIQKSSSVINPLPTIYTMYRGGVFIKKERYHTEKHGIVNKWYHRANGEIVKKSMRPAGAKFQKNEGTILHLISLCETFDLEPFWNLGWPGTLLGVCGWSLRTDLRQYWDTKVTSISRGTPHAMRRFGWICCCVVVTLSLRCCRSFPARYAVIWRHWFCLNSLTGNTRT